MRKKIVAGNWKMNKSFPDAVSLAAEIAKELSHKVIPANFEAVIIPPFPYLRPIAEVTFGSTHLLCGAQNCSSERSGAFTGEVSAEMISSCGAEYVIIGHSERRTLFGETDEIVSRKIGAALDSGLIAIVCIGESSKERKAGQHLSFVKNQLKQVMDSVAEEMLGHLVIAYEPVWAIGTGETASPEQAGEVHAMIRQELVDRYEEAGSYVSLLYGGSCNPSNAAALFGVKDIDGGLIGGASLKAQDFLAIFDALPHH